MAHGLLIFLFNLLTLLILGVQGTPYEAYPISKQYPPIARANEQFTFTISNDTYKSNIDKTSQISYQIYGLPEWLAFDTGSRTLSGVPPSNLLEDNNSSPYYFNIILEGTDTSDNSALNNTYRLVVASKSNIELASNFNLLAFLKNYGNTNGKDGLILSPNDIFNVTFDRTIFNNGNQIKEFYGRSAQYNAPLPSWLFFDSNDLEFSGTTPVVNSQIAPEVYYDLVLIATEIEGFSDIEIPFSLVIGGHQLTTSIQNTILLNVTDDGSFTYKLPLNYVFLDGSPVNRDNISAITLNNAPSWVSLDSNDTLSGTMTSAQANATFNVAINDVYGDVIYLNFEVKSTRDLFAVKSLPNINATRGEWFNYSFLPSQFTDYSNTNISITFTNSSQSDHDWIRFKDSNLTLQGNVPENFNSLSMGLIAKQASISQQLNFTIFGMDSHKNNTNATKSSSSHHSKTTSHSSSAKTSSISMTSSLSSTFTTSSSTISATSSTSALATQSKSTKKNNKKTVAIVCGVVIPVAVILLLLLLFFLLWRRRKQNQDKEDDPEDKGEKLPRKISDPSLNNAANNPNQTLTSLENPFEDTGNIAAVNAMRLDEESISSSDSDFSSDEKNHSDISNGNRFTVSSQENLLKKEGIAAVATAAAAAASDDKKSSSFYMDAKPTSRKSWRYNPHYNKSDLDPINMNKRGSMASLNTVSTSELFNTELRPNETIPKDPRKSTLGLRDSVFWNNTTNYSTNNSSKVSTIKKNKDTLKTLNESPDVSSHASSSTDDFIPIKEGESYNWKYRTSPSRNPSQKKLVKLASQSNVNVGKVQNFEGHTAELV